MKRYFSSIIMLFSVECVSSHNIYASEGFSDVLVPTSTVQLAQEAEDIYDPIYALDKQLAFLNLIRVEYEPEPVEASEERKKKGKKETFQEFKRKIFLPDRDIAETTVDIYEVVPLMYSKKSADEVNAIYDQLLRKMFCQYVDSQLKKYFEMWAGIATGTSKPNEALAQKGIKAATKIGSTLGSLLPPPGGIIVKAVCGVAEEVTSIVFLQKAKEYAAKVYQLYTNDEFSQEQYGLESWRQQALASQFALLLTHRYREQIVHLEPDDLKTLSRMTIIPAVNYAIQDFDNYKKSKDAKIAHLLIRGAMEKPKSFDDLTRCDTKFTVKDSKLTIRTSRKIFDGWDLLNKSAIFSTNDRIYSPPQDDANSFLKLFLQEGLVFYRYGYPDEENDLHYREGSPVSLDHSTASSASQYHRKFMNGFGRLLRQTLSQSKVLAIMAEVGVGIGKTAAQ